MRYSGLVGFPTFPPRRALTHMVGPLTWAAEVSLGRSQQHLLSPQPSQYVGPRPTYIKGPRNKVRQVAEKPKPSIGVPGCVKGLPSDVVLLW
jgi:hypothetical protein